MPISVGDLLGENVLRDQFVVSSVDYDSDEPFRTRTPQLDWVRGFGIVLVVEDYVRDLVLDETDHVVASTKTWTFANGAFTAADVGGTFTVTDSVADDGTYTIASVTNATTIVSTEAVAGDETFDPDTVTVSVTSAPLQASTSVDVSNDYVNEKLPGLGQLASEGHWADVSDMFDPAPPDITIADNTFFQADPLDARTARINIVPTAGASLVSLF